MEERVVCEVERKLDSVVVCMECGMRKDYREGCGLLKIRSGG
ncbi:putative Disease resistance protein RPH8A [Corchorus olitorius]|uniref:Disease resistance protein RPH8A n=1 Tax=Corchorus olitorius TaxID=93759 RepID=A0A1R3GFP7_9ROSI|nr:putative Disease resistance protein RPH8A [Corchorus olitorius]